MAISKEELIKLLNNDIAWEFTATIQYVQHAGVLTGAEFGDIIKEIKIHANEELQHAIVLAEQIDFLGGVPSVKTYPAKTSKDNKEMLQQDLDGEEDAIKRYKQRITQAEDLGEEALAQKLREILAMEQEHAMDLRQALGK